MKKIKMKVQLALYLVVVIAAAGFAAQFAYQYAIEQTAHEFTKEVEQAIEETAAEYQVRIEAMNGDREDIIKGLKQELINKLRQGESGGVDTGSTIFYTNDPSSANREVCARIGGRRDLDCDSWGVMQFKIPTIVWYYPQIYGTEITEKEALILALNDEKAMDFASRIIFEIEGGVWNWSAAQNDATFYTTQIPFIRSLEK